MNLDEGPLRLGPLVRYVDETTATVWVETVEAAQVTVRCDDRDWSAGTFAAHGHHYALVDIDGLRRGSVHEYTVEVDGEPVWPPPDSPYPPSRIATLDLARGPRIAFGSCRVSAAQGGQGNRDFGTDALTAYAHHMASGERDPWPDLLLFLGDQVYADETSPQMQQFIRSRRDPNQPPGLEIKDFEEYCHLYRLAWEEPTVRWLLSTLPTAMIFDDHDIRDDWDTSYSWRQEITTLPWWHDRIVGGLGSYWVYQHAGNLSPDERAADPVWRHIADGHRADNEEPDITAVLDALAATADAHSDSYRWSYTRDLGRTRLVMVDSRASRCLTPQERSILDATEMAWLDRQLQGGPEHFLVGTSLPYLLARGLHYVEAWNEAVADGAYGRGLMAWGERVRRAIDLEHWAAFQTGFVNVATILGELATGQRGPAPATITFLSGDVHHSYVADVDTARTWGGTASRVVQAVCSPVRNPLPSTYRRLVRYTTSPVVAAIGRFLSCTARLPAAPLHWRIVRGPWTDNNLATLTVHGKRIELLWETAHEDGTASPYTRTVADFTIDEHSGGRRASLMQQVRTTVQGLLHSALRRRGL